LFPGPFRFYTPFKRVQDSPINRLKIILSANQAAKLLGKWLVCKRGGLFDFPSQKKSETQGIASSQD
jgi:hypothetical protein